MYVLRQKTPRFCFKITHKLVKVLPHMDSNLIANENHYFLSGVVGWWVKKDN